MKNKKIMFQWIAVASVLIVIFVLSMMIRWPESPQESSPDTAEIIATESEQLTDSKDPSSSNEEANDAKVVKNPKIKEEAPIETNDKIIAKTKEEESLQCIQAELQSDSDDLKGSLHEFKTPFALKDMNSLCLTLEGETLPYTQLSKSVIRIDRKFSDKNSKIVAQYCQEGVKCEIKCPAPKKDFWDSLELNTNTVSDAGFLDADSVEVKALQNEITELKKVLYRSPAKAKVTQWKVAESKNVKCK